MLIEKVAGEMAATWFEAAKNTPGMDTLRKRYRNDPRRYARMNLEKFIPIAIQTLVSMLGMDHVKPEYKEEIFEAIQSRVNDPSNITSDDLMTLPNLDMSKLNDLISTKTEQFVDQSLVPKREKPINIKTDLKNSSTTTPNPFKAVRH